MLAFLSNFDKIRFQTKKTSKKKLAFTKIFIKIGKNQ